MNNKFDIRFVPTEIDQSATSAANKSADIQEPLPACTKTANIIIAKKRMLSHREKQHTEIRNNTFLIIKKSEMLHIPRGRNNIKSCALCKWIGHSRTNCVR